MRIISLLAALLCLTVASAGVDWAPAPENYRLSADGAVDISDGGKSQPDLYLLTARDHRDFILDFDMTSSPCGGPQVRALVVWSVDPADKANRKAFFLPTDRLTPGKPAHFRLVVAADRAVLRLNGAVVGTTLVPYGTPPASGRLGFLHYYNHNFRYENLTLRTLDPASLPAPQNLQARLEKSGVCKLQWEVPEVYQDLLQYRVYRVEGSKPASLIATVNEPQFLDRGLRSNSRYQYSIVAAFGEGTGTKPAQAVVKTGALPPPAAPTQLSAVRRLDGQVRLKWQLAPDSRAQGVSIHRAATAAEAAKAGQALVTGLTTEGTSFLAPAAVADWYAIAVISPDGTVAKRAVCRATASAPEVKAGLGVPERHPYLLYSTEQLDHARAALQANDEGQKLAASLRGSADAQVRTPASVPTGVTDDMSSLSNRLQQVGLYYQLLGDEKYAQWVHDALLGYARLYPTLPDRGKRVKLSKTVSGLYEAVWYVPLILAYDLVYESPCFTLADHQQIEKDLLRPAAELFWVKDYNDPKDGRPADLHYKCYNFQAWFDSAVGLTGLMLKDADMVEHALDGPYGLKHLLAHDVQDDGLFWERSAGYHSFVISALFPLLQAAYNCNLDLYRLQVPDDYNTDREKLLNYCVGDGDNGPKSLKLMFDGPFYYTFPDYTWPVVADSGKGPLSANAAYRAAWERYRDPKYAWLINRSRLVTVPKVGEGDAQGAVRLSYDDKSVYLTAQITDQVVRNSHDQPGEVWQGDLLWVGLKWRDEKFGPYDVIYGLSPGDADKVKPVAVIFDRFGKTVGEVSAARYAVARSAGGYTLEAAIPLSELAPRPTEQGVAFAPKEGQKLTADFVIYDCDAKTGATTKEKMVCWACKTDRYDSSQGGEVVIGPQQPRNPPAINMPRAQGIVVDGNDADWQRLPPQVAQITSGSTVMTDASSAGLNLDDLLYERPVETGSFKLTDGKFCNNGLVSDGCSLFPSTGFALLRGTPFSVNLTYGPYGGGHGHPDKLSLVVWDDNKHLIPDFGSCKYESPEKAQWTSHTVSHNTLTVDGKSQMPAGETDHGFLADSYQEKSWGKLDFFYTTPTIKVVQAHVEGLFPGVKLTRTVALLGEKLLDVYRVESNDRHVYDYALHLDEPLVQASVPLDLMAGETLGTKCGYQHIHSPRGSTLTTGGLQTEWGERSKGHYISVAGGEPTQLITAESVTNSLDRLMPMMILRREASNTTFATCLTKVLPSTCSIDKDGTIRAEGGTAASLFLSPTPDRPARCGEGTVTARMVATYTAGDAGETAYCDFRELRGRDTITSDRPCDFTIRWAFTRQTLVMGTKPARITYKPREGKAVTINAKPGQTYTLPEAQ
ncbi:MAG: heparinase II/III family protein [Armatimonadia bacterium]